MWVVKLGGSLWESACLKDWLDQLVALSQPVVLVPGGGPFADQVRRAQAQWQFDDGSAHHMALLAMEQMAHMLCALSPPLTVVGEHADFAAVMDDGRVPVWLPVRMIQRERGVPASWTVTSDSLAAWLAGRLGADGLLLVKSATFPAGRSRVSSLQKEGLIDQAFERFSAQAACPIWVLNREQSAALPALMKGDSGPSMRIVI